jgi:hypothetical protein
MKSTKTDDALQRRRQLKAEMVLRGIVGCQLARELGITPMAVYHVTSGRKKIKRVIAKLIELGVPASCFEEGVYGSAAESGK